MTTGSPTRTGTFVPGRTILAWWLVTWVVGAAVLAVAVIPPERCSEPTPETLAASTAAASDWAVVNQYDDDRWRYEFERESARDRPGYNIVRHAGVMTALYQRHAWVGDDDAFESAERGLDWIEGELAPAGEGITVREGTRGTTGGSALLLAALSFRRDASGATDRDPLMAGLARFLVGQQLANGAISERFDLTTGEMVPDAFSPFSTGEAMWALALAGDRLGVPEWRDAARLTLDYVALERDDAEPEFPPNDDHWAGYALGELAPDGLEPHHRDYVRRLAGLWSAEVRFDSQRTGDGVNRLVRGGLDRSGVQGTNLEGMSGLWRAAAVDDALADVRDDLRDRIACAADMLTRRQVTDAEAAVEPIPTASAGAWFRDGLTRMDTQQHALAGLTGATAVLAAEGPSGEAGTDWAEIGAVALLVAALMTARGRATDDAMGTDAPTALIDAMGTDAPTALIVLVPLALAVGAGPAVLAAGDVSPTTAWLAVGMTALASLVAGWVGREPPHWAWACWYPPVVVTLAVAAADLGRPAAVGAGLAGVAVAELVERGRRSRSELDMAVASSRDTIVLLGATVALVLGAIGL